VPVPILVERDPLVGVAQELRQDVLALLDRRVPQVLAIEFEEVERPLSLQTTASPSISLSAFADRLSSGFCVGFVVSYDVGL
jgi:hypothetical protein